jgi:hypothetical protein
MTQKVMMAIDQNLLVDDPNLFHVNSDEQYLKSREDLLETFKNNDYSRRISTALFERACDNTMDVASKCSEFEPDFSPKLPRFDDANNTLRTECVKNLKKRGLDKDEKKYLVDGRMVTHTEQMEIELERLIDKEYASYFLITRDLIQASLKKGWILGPGRGSCAGSLVCYLLDITTINPLLWGGLSFNRFLSPARGGKMLKVDMDLLDNNVFQKLLQWADSKPTHNYLTSDNQRMIKEILEGSRIAGHADKNVDIDLYDENGLEYTSDAVERGVLFYKPENSNIIQLFKSLKPYSPDWHYMFGLICGYDPEKVFKWVQDFKQNPW